MVDKADNKKQAYAKAKSIRTSGQKLNLIAKSIRGCNIKVAIDQLTFSKKRVSREVFQKNGRIKSVGIGKSTFNERRGGVETQDP